MRSPSPVPRVDAGLLVLRLGLAVLLLFHGIFKLTHGVDWISRPLAAVGLPGFLRYGTYVAEVVAPVMLILGLWTRAAALVIAFDMVMAVFLVRRGDIGKISPMSGAWAIEIEAMYFIAAVTLALAGGGRYGIGGTRTRSG
jgi:putative oxidoreductase